jgi:divalent metal cation (Fe/Co/Zn/Cd) transporter
LVATLLFRFLGWNIDGYMGLLVGGFIFVAGIRVLRETMNSILGEQPSAEVVEHIRAVVADYPEAVGVHDMLVHNYGPGRLYVSLHIEVDGSRDIYEMHDCIDNIEKRLGEELGAYCTIHMDPIVTDDESVTALRRQVEEAVHAVDDRLGIHDFRVVSGPTHTNLIFDVTVPFECPMSDNAVKAAVAGQVSRLDESYCTVLTVDRV